MTIVFIGDHVLLNRAAPVDTISMKPVSFFRVLVLTNTRKTGLFWMIFKARRKIPCQKSQVGQPKKKKERRALTSSVDRHLTLSPNARPPFPRREPTCSGAAPHCDIQSLEGRNRTEARETRAKFLRECQNGPSAKTLKPPTSWGFPSIERGKGAERQESTPAVLRSSNLRHEPWHALC